MAARSEYRAASNRCLDMALFYARRGLAVLPVHHPVRRSNGLRCSCKNPRCDSPGKHPLSAHGLHDATTDESDIRDWWRDWPTANVGIATGATSGIIVLDVDPRHGGDDALSDLEREYGRLPETWCFETGGGGEHILFRHPGGHVPNSVGKLGPGLDVRGDGGYILAPPSLHISGHPYRIIPEGDPDTVSLAAPPNWLLQLLGNKAKSDASGSNEFNRKFAFEGVPEGQRDESLYRYASSCRARGIDKGEAIELIRIAAARCSPPFDEAEAIKKVERVYQDFAFSGSWPEPLTEPAFHGLAGEIVRIIEPHTEADPAALLVQFLVTFGNVIGRDAFFTVEADRHHLNLFATLVGETAKSRKGTSWAHVRRLFEQVDARWSKDRVQTGLASGEGVTWHVRNTRDEVGGVMDKRLLVVEAEFASTLRILNREGNTLSPILRNAWDGRDLMNLTKKNPVRATGPHISIIGHITKDELRRYLSRTESGNGFANRFLWVCVQRSKVLPSGGRFHEVDVEPLVKKLGHAVRYAEGIGDLYRGAEAEARWHKVYADLSEGKPGMFGAVTARAEAIVMRLASVYALLDHTFRIRDEHLEAALQVWRYCEDSARFIFGESIGNSVADEIWRALRDQPDGMSRSDISRLFSGNRSKADIDRALEALQQAGKAVCLTEKREGGGRPVERWHAAP